MDLPIALCGACSYPFYTFGELRTHLAVVYVPYYYNSVKFTELYRHGRHTPEAAPSMRLPFARARALSRPHKGARSRSRSLGSGGGGEGSGRHVLARTDTCR